MKTIEVSAFESCSNLSSIIIGNGVTEIQAYAFYNCSSLTGITIGKNVKIIGSSAFERCSSLTSVIFEAPNGWWRSYFYSDTSGTSITGLNDPATAAQYLRSTWAYYYWKRS